MLLKSSRTSVMLQIGVISLFSGVISFADAYFDKKSSLLSGLVFATIITFFIFVILTVFILPYDITADNNYLFIKQYFRRYKIPWSNILMVKLYTRVLRGVKAPMMTLMLKDDETVTQGIGILNKKNTNILIGLFKSHEIPIEALNNTNGAPTSEWPLKVGILDVLKDDGNSIEQILKYLKYLKINCSEEIVKAEIIRLLNDEFIRIEYPSVLNAKEFYSATGEKLSDFWFELTPKGKAEWARL
ncbi:hypothetical protein [Desulfosporosinus sp. SB140]|uniref:hypothetical protein n=1 Tax=Desulfosporosinus paludis TaxID=3115649 RepID=UPI00388FDA6D